MTDRERAGPLAGLLVVEMAGLGPAPLACLMLAEMGATVLRIQRAGRDRGFLELPAQFDLSLHGRASLELDLKHPEALALASRVIGGADILVEGYRPGVMERLGLGPEIMTAANPRLVYTRMTGFGQSGPLAPRAGHDLNYLAISGLLHAIGPDRGKPVPPLNLVADYGGGAMFLLAGILAALVERAGSGQGQVVDAAMLDGAAMLGAPTFAYLAAGLWRDRRGENLLDGGAPFYDTYECADGRFVAVACLEPRFFAEFARLLPLPASYGERQYDRAHWPEMRAAIAARFGERGRDEWTALFEGTDACVTPVLSLGEAPAHPQNQARSTFARTGPMTRPAPAPRFSRTPGHIQSGPVVDLAATLRDFGIGPEEAEALAGRQQAGN